MKNDIVSTFKEKSFRGQVWKPRDLENPTIIFENLKKNKKNKDTSLAWTVRRSQPSCFNSVYDIVTRWQTFPAISIAGNVYIININNRPINIINIK